MCPRWTVVIYLQPIDWLWYTSRDRPINPGARSAEPNQGKYWRKHRRQSGPRAALRRRNHQIRRWQKEQRWSSPIGQREVQEARPKEATQRDEVNRGVKTSIGSAARRVEGVDQGSQAMGWTLSERLGQDWGNHYKAFGQAGVGFEEGQEKEEG